MTERHETFVHPYIPNSAPLVRKAMLAATGARSIEDFFQDVPADLRVEGLLDLPGPFLAEHDLERHVEGLLARNVQPPVGLTFLGAGTYLHHVPAVVDEVIGRSEFLTAYAGEPYEDHGRFQALFEYQSLMAALLELDVVTVPTYDGFQAAGTALAMAGRATGRPRVLLVGDVLPDKLSKVHDYVQASVGLEQIPTLDGTADVDAVLAALGPDVAAVWVETPSAHGALEPALAQLADAAHRHGALLVVGCEPLMLGVVEPPSVHGADIVCGDIQSLGIHPWFGGGHAGFLAVRDDPRLIMELPSRIFGLATTDVPGEYGFGDVAYERTSFAAREDGKEWVGTAGALWGIAAGVYLALMGPEGMRELGETILARTAYAARRLSALPGVRLTDGAVHFRELCLDLSGSGTTAPAVVAALRRVGIEPGVPLDESNLLVCVTETTAQADIDTLAGALRTHLEEVSR